MRLTRVSQRRGDSGIVFNGSTSAPLREETVEIAISAPNQKRAASDCAFDSIDSESPAAKAGLREGDVIQEVNKQSVKNAKDLVAISKKLKPNEKILMRVYSQGRSGYVALEPK
jgi:serine protease Do